MLLVMCSGLLCVVDEETSAGLDVCLIIIGSSACGVESNENIDDLNGSLFNGGSTISSGFIGVCTWAKVFDICIGVCDGTRMEFCGSEGNVGIMG